ncbi:MAG: HAD-IA family hydrolase [Candidatus Ratteibacteria bacterium]|nr:HAD-IA family hydrolase [Candidatus Ratteibacteria bacterium]
MKNMKGTIFDFDGTLVTLSIDFKKIKEKILREAEKYGLKMPAFNLPILEFLEKIKKINGKKGRDFYIIGHKILREEELRASKHTKPQKGALDVLKRLKGKGIKIGIITRNCREVVEDVIRRFDIPCDVLLTRDDVNKVKPDVSHIKECLKLIGLKADDVILVGDHPFDVRAGKRAGILSIGLKSASIPEDDFVKEGADFVIEDIGEIEYIIGEKGFKAGKLPNRFLRYLLEKYTAGKDRDVISSSGVGIDCAIFKVKDRAIFAKTDPITLTSKDIGFYLVNINVNDIAVMGGIPSYLLTVLLFPEGTTFTDIEYVFSQIGSECKRFGIKWVGGHTEMSGGIASPVAVGLMIGQKLKGLQKKKAKKGDRVFLVKEAGIEGASVIAREKYPELRKHFSERYLQKVKNAAISPGISIFKEAKILWENFNIKYMHDPTEGGISTALYEMAEANNIGLLLYPEKMRFYPPAVKFCKIFGLNPLGLISSGCIVGIISKKEEKKLLDFCRRNRIKAEIIGCVVDAKTGVWYVENGIKSEFPRFTRDEINRLL